MDTKRRFDDDSGESSDEKSSDQRDYSSVDDIDGENIKVLENLEDDSEDYSNGILEYCDNVSIDEDDWRQETDVSDVESVTDYDDEEPSRHLSNFDQQSTLSTYSSKSGRQWNKATALQRKIPQANILRRQMGVGRRAAGMQTEKDAFQLLFTE